MTKSQRQEFIRNNKMIYFNRFRYFFFEWTSMKAYQKILVPETVVGFIYQFILFFASAAASAIFIYNHFQLQEYSVTKHFSQEQFDHTIYFIKTYFNVFYALNFVFLLDFLMRWMYADYTYNTLTRLKAFSLMPFRFVNLLDLTSFIIAVTIYNVVISHNLHAIEQVTSLEEKIKYFNNIVFDKAAMDVFPSVILARILGLHHKVIKFTIASGQVNFFLEIIRRRWNVLLSSFILLILTTFFLSFIVYRVEQDYYNDFNIPIDSDERKFKDFGSAMWFAVGTITTIAYGDITPVSKAGRVFGAILGLGGVAFFGFITSLLASGIVSLISEKTRSMENNRLQALQSENERLLHEFSSKLKKEIIEELVKHEARLENVTVQEVQVDKTDLLDKEKSRKKQTRKKVYYDDITSLTKSKQMVFQKSTRKRTTNKKKVK
ncbi:potassium channel family protein [Ureaplasma diversum]|uniref:Potassium channel protein n=1 Tax=Ureaplasma diversum NCTC 246 TaxID=1188241 RepID=A0A084EWN2_9BACT|nr:potassium channel family protein [Ureaplasma diversum]KEZ22374.1 Potassium channel protein [Ureaplasma diversum NCTC 246]